MVFYVDAVDLNISASTEPKEEKKQIDIGKEAAMEAEVRAARERAIVPLEIRIKSFREMLAEKEVHTSFTSINILQFSFIYSLNS